jgi:hypothetical protein
MSKIGRISASESLGEDASAHESQLAGVLADAEGLIPEFPPRAVDEQGRLIPLSAEERRARNEALLRALTALRGLPDDDPPDTLERLMRGVDEHRQPGRKLFGGMS